MTAFNILPFVIVALSIVGHWTLAEQRLAATYILGMVCGSLAVWLNVELFVKDASNYAMLSFCLVGVSQAFSSAKGLWSFRSNANQG